MSGSGRVVKGYGGGGVAVSSAELKKQLIFACRDGEYEKVKHLIENEHVDPHSCRDTLGYYGTPLHWASYWGHLDIVRLLVEEQKCDLMSMNNGDRTPLHRAAIQGRLDIVQYLIKEGGCDPMCRGGKGRTPLHDACQEGRIGVVKYLVEEAKVDASCRDDNDITPLHIASMCGKLAVVKLLVEKYQCDPAFRAKHGVSPADMAERNGHIHVTSYLNSEKKPAVKRPERKTVPKPEFPQQVFRLPQKRGLAILVTCDYEGTGTPPLPSTNGDADEMRKTFEQFDYDIHQLKNGAATEHAITALLKQASDYLSRYGGPKKNKDGEKKVIIFAFSGHGDSCGNSDDQIKSNDGQLLSLRENVRLPLVTHPNVRDIPKLFFIDACRGSDHLKKKVLEKGYSEVETNFRIDYATIPDHKAYGDTYTSFWMPVLARKLRETNAAFSSVIDKVNEDIYAQDEVLQQPETVSRLRGTLKLYYKK